MRHVDRRTNALPTNRPTNRPTDTASYRGALSHLKSRISLIGNIGLRPGELSKPDCYSRHFYTTMGIKTTVVGPQKQPSTSLTM